MHHRSRSSLTPRERQRLLKEATDRARARAERPARQAANAAAWAATLERREALAAAVTATASRVDAAMDRLRIEQRTREAVMGGWKLAHDAELARGH